MDIVSVRKQPTEIEWVGGIVRLPSPVTGEGAPYHPEVLVWTGPSGAVLGHLMGKPGALATLACESLRSTITKPLVGQPHAPDRVRVASPELAEALRAGSSQIEIVCAPTPEIDKFAEAMRKGMSAPPEIEQSYLSPTIPPSAIAAFFRAAAALFRAKPWQIVPSDQDLFSVTIESLGLSNAALSVIGQMGQSLGLIVFSGIDDFEAYLDAVYSMEHGGAPSAPPHFSLNFERGAELSAALHEEIAAHGWEVAGAEAHPWLAAWDADLVSRPAAAREVTIAEAIALALVEVVKQEEELRATWSDGEPFVRTLVVATAAGEVEVSLRTPYERSEYERPKGILADLFELGRDGDEIDSEARRPIEEELLRQFEDSHEAKALTVFHSCGLVMDLAANYFNATIATLTPGDLGELVFELIPRKVSIDASEASGIIAGSRAFYAFLKREFGLAQAEACLRVLGGGAVRRLEAALSDTSKFGMAKSFLMGGREAGFDMQSQEGIEAWGRDMQSRPFSGLLPPSSSRARPQHAAAARAKKNARKTARKARKKNR